MWVNMLLVTSMVTPLWSQGGNLWDTNATHSKTGPHLCLIDDQLVDKVSVGHGVIDLCHWSDWIRLCLPGGPQAQKYIQSLPFMPQQDLEKIFRGANPMGEQTPDATLLQNYPLSPHSQHLCLKRGKGMLFGCSGYDWMADSILYEKL